MYYFNIQIKVEFHKNFFLFFSFFHEEEGNSNMARRFKRRRRYGRKRRSRRFRKSGRTRGISWRNKRGISFRRMPTIMPDCLFVKLKYHFPWTAVATAFTFSKQISGNNVYDPNPALGGGQPTGFDEYQGMYEHYECVGSSCRVRLHNNSNTDIIEMFLYPSQGTSDQPRGDPYTTPYSKNRIVGTVDYGSTKTIKSYMSWKKMVGSRGIRNRNIAVTNAAPLDPWFWTVDFRNVPGDQNLNAYYDMLVTYYVKFSKRILNLIDV
jgi:hypothetical protein